MSKFENLTVRIAAALIAIPFFIWSAVKGGYLFFFLITFISSLVLYEFYTLSEKKGAKPLKTIGIIAGVLINSVFLFERYQTEILKFIFKYFGFYLPLYSEYQLLVIILVKLVLVVLLIELFRKKGSPLINVSATITGVLVVSLCFTTLILLRELFPSSGFPFQKFYSATFLEKQQYDEIGRWGGWTIIGVLCSIWMCDTAAYFGGSKFGKHLLFEQVSPKKTWEGAIFGFIFAVITMLTVKILALDYLTFLHATIVGALIGVFGQLGDLIESRFKRDAGVKDSSSVIPGHGGVYDRFDSLVYISPIVYLYIYYLVL